MIRFCQLESDDCREILATSNLVSLFDVRVEPFGEPSIMMIYSSSSSTTP
jgi:hypothetical protein